MQACGANSLSFLSFFFSVLPSEKCTRSNATQLSLFNEPINL
jgi:hypothetical protein